MQRRRILQLAALGYGISQISQAGQEVFRSLVKSFYNRASCVILTYCSPLQMEKKIRSSLDLIREDIPQEASIFIVRTKTDLCEVYIWINEERKNRSFFWMSWWGEGKSVGGGECRRSKTKTLMRQWIDYVVFRVGF